MAHIENGADFFKRLKEIGNTKIEIQANSLVKSGWPPESRAIHPESLLEGRKVETLLPGREDKVVYTQGRPEESGLYRHGMITSALGNELGPAAIDLKHDYNANAGVPETSATSFDNILRPNGMG